jgi:sugar (pentulose or hexulose) kinase
MNGVVAVLDIGKTNVKVATFDSDGAIVWERAIPNRVAPGPPYPHADVDTIWRFLLAALAEANKVQPLATIVATAHACTGAFVGDEQLLLPVMDYEFAGVEEIEPTYASMRPLFSESFSPKLPAGLNLARQIAWQQAKFPDACDRAQYYLTYPQYWAWRLCGIAASEVTYLGAHTDMWAPLEQRASRVVGALRLARLMAPMRKGYDLLGSLDGRIAAAAGLRAEVGVLCGVHDSNASLLPHLASRKAPFTIVSTGTWVILMAVGLALDRLDPTDDTLANVDVEGRPVATARFMGGREYAAIAGAPACPDAASIARVIASRALALPCFAGQGGPFPRRKGEIVGETAAADLPALATLYVALMSDLMLTRLGVDTGDLIIEGSFAANPAYCALLAALRPSQPVFSGSDAAGTARGAALLAQWPMTSSRPSALTYVKPAATDSALVAYRQAWTKAVLAHC